MLSTAQDAQRNDAAYCCRCIVQGGPKTALFLRDNNFATVRSGICQKVPNIVLTKYKTEMSVKLNILCIVCINIQCIWNYAEFYPIFHSNKQTGQSEPVVWPVCLSECVGHNHVPCKSGCTNQDVVWLWHGWVQGTMCWVGGGSAEGTGGFVGILRPVAKYVVYQAYTHTHPFNGPFSGTTRVSRYQKGKTNLDFLWSKRQWVAVASAGPYASLHLTPDR